MEIVFDAKKEIESKLENLDEVSKMSILIDELKNENNNRVGMALRVRNTPSIQ